MSTAAHTHPAITLGSTVLCSDDNVGALNTPGGRRGEVLRIVFDPLGRRVTHLVVGGPDGARPGWLVPIGLATPVVGAVRLRCSAEELRALEAAKPPPAPNFGDAARAGSGGRPAPSGRESRDQSAINPGDRVRALDGVIGDALGILADGRDPAQVTHLLVAMGLGIGPRRVAVPVRRISSLKDGVQLTLSVSEIRELPAYEVEG